MKNNKTNLRFFFIFLAAILPQSCAKELEEAVPETYVNINLNLSHYSIGINQSLVLTNTMVNVSSLGYNNNGIILFRYSQDEFYAYDRTCPYHVEESVAVELDGNQMFAICPECGSKYQLWYYGTPTDAGPSINPLKQYRVFYNPNTFEINISN
ncbi:MAG: hypothetical protein JXB00_03625 [Bacteroidales bacterium]|nr:hypothetical protein [Bacteroidales bacterium]